MRTTIWYKLCFGLEGVVNFVLYLDVNYAKSIVNKKNTSKIIALLGGGFVFWISKKQNFILTLTTKSEYIV